MLQKFYSVLYSEGTFHSTHASGTFETGKWYRSVLGKVTGNLKIIVIFLKWEPFYQKFWKFWEKNHDQVKGKLLFRIFSTTWVYLTSLSITYMYLIITNQSSRCQHGRILLNFFTVLIYFFYIFLQQLNDLFQCIKVCLGLIFQAKSYK